VREGGERGGAPGSKSEIHFQPLEKTTLKQVASLRILEDHAGAEACALNEDAAHGESMLYQAPGRSSGPRREAHAGAGLLAGPVTPWRIHARAVCS